MGTFTAKLGSRHSKLGRIVLGRRPSAAVTAPLEHGSATRTSRADRLLLATADGCVAVSRCDAAQDAAADATPASVGADSVAPDATAEAGALVASADERQTAQMDAGVPAAAGDATATASDADSTQTAIADPAERACTVNADA